MNSNTKMLSIGRILQMFGCRHLLQSQLRGLLFEDNWSDSTVSILKKFPFSVDCQKNVNSQIRKKYKIPPNEILQSNYFLKIERSEKAAFNEKPGLV